MHSLFAAARSLVYAFAFVLIWGWLALLFRDVAIPGLSRLPEPSRVAGVLLMATGGAIVLWCVSLFSVVGRGTPAPFDPPRALVPVGAYRWVRNPMYVGALTVLAGFGLWHRSPAMLLFVIPAALAAHTFVVLYEEPTLERKFGAEYIRYRSRVHRWVPRPPAEEKIT